MLQRETLGRLQQAGTDRNWDDAIDSCEELAKQAVGKMERELVEFLTLAVQAQQAEMVENLVRIELEPIYEFTIPGSIEQAQADGREDIVENLKEEARILNIIHQTTGCEYRRLQGVPVDDQNVAEQVLPLLAEQLSSDCLSATRSDIYELMLMSGRSQPFFEKLLGMVSVEGPSGIETDSWLRAVAESCTDEDEVRRAWVAIQTKERVGSWYEAAAKLANHKTAPAEIAAELRRTLDEENVPSYVAEDISKVKDRRIKDWFRERLDSEDEHIARVARRIAAKPVKAPDGVVYPAAGAWPGIEVESAEVDLPDISGILREYRGRWGLKVPRWLLSRKSLEFMDLGQSAAVDLTSKIGDSFTIYLRMEDYDTIEIRLFQRGDAAS